MRVIKFRAWDKMNKKMYAPVAIGIQEKNGLIQSYTKSGDLVGTGSTSKPNVLMQFTSLKDKNGKEIYEGDVVQDLTSNADVSEIKWSNKYHGWEPWVNYGGGYDSFEGNPVNVIGNIYENPELLDITDHE